MPAWTHSHAEEEFCSALPLNEARKCRTTTLLSAARAPRRPTCQLGQVPPRARGGPDRARHLQHPPRQLVVALLLFLLLLAARAVLAAAVLVLVAAAAAARGCALGARGALALGIQVLLLRVCAPRLSVCAATRGSEWRAVQPTPRRHAAACALRRRAACLRPEQVQEQPCHVQCCCSDAAASRARLGDRELVPGEGVPQSAAGGCAPCAARALGAASSAAAASRSSAAWRSGTPSTSLSCCAL